MPAMLGAGLEGEPRPLVSIRRRRLSPALARLFEKGHRAARRSAPPRCSSSGLVLPLAASARDGQDTSNVLILLDSRDTGPGALHERSSLPASGSGASGRDIQLFSSSSACPRPAASRAKPDSGIRDKPVTTVEPGDRRHRRTGSGHRRACARYRRGCPPRPPPTTTTTTTMTTTRSARRRERPPGTAQRRPRGRAGAGDRVPRGVCRTRARRRRRPLRARRLRPCLAREPDRSPEGVHRLLVACAGEQVVGLSAIGPSQDPDAGPASAR